MQPEGLMQADCTVAMVRSTPEDRCNEQELADKPTPHGHTLHVPQYGRLTEEKTEDTSGGGMYPVPGRKLRADFCPADRLLLQCNTLSLNLITLFLTSFIAAMTRPMWRSLIIKNPNPYPIAFKLETTVPEVRGSKISRRLTYSCFSDSCTFHGQIQEGLDPIRFFGQRVSPVGFYLETVPSGKLPLLFAVRRKPYPQQPPSSKRGEHKFFKFRIKFSIIAPEQQNLSEVKVVSYFLFCFAFF